MLNSLICHFLNIFFKCFQFIFSNFFCFFLLFSFIHSVTADITNSNFSIFADLLHFLSKITASFFCQSGNDQTNNCTVTRRGNTKIRSVECALNIFDRRFVKRRHQKDTRFRNRDRRDLIEWSFHSIILN